jgi:sec-independent protein translocase protein TatA
MSLGWPQLLLIALVILVLFGRGKISEMMGDFGKGIKSFKKGMAEDDSKPAAQIENQPAADATETKQADSSTTSN